jgi:hypothetical protein
MHMLRQHVLAVMRPSSGLYRAQNYNGVGTQWDPIGFTVEL